MYPSKIIYKTSLKSSSVPITKFIKLLQKVFPNSNWNKKIFSWKHFDNPFGYSIFVWAILENKIVGFRSLWKMKLTINGKSVLAYQPCDTAVLPEYRGRGIFTEMTKIGREIVLSKGGQFLFNFPTQMSLGGYLKLGWKSKSAISRYIHIAKPLSVSKKSLFDRWWRSDRNIIVPKNIVKPKDFDNKNLYHHNAKLLNLKISKKYLIWRFCKKPNFTYGIVSEDKNQIIYRVILRSKVKIVELVVWTQSANNKIEKKLINKIINSEQPEMITFVMTNNKPILFLNKFFFKTLSKLNFIAYDNSNNSISEKIVFQPILYDTI